MGISGFRRWAGCIAVSIALAVPVLASSGYIISTFNGFLAVWQKGQTTPYLITDTLVSSLPPADQVLIEQGIYFENETGVTGALEDYCS